MIQKGVLVLVAFVVVLVVLAQDRTVPPRKNMLETELVLMAQACEWPTGRLPHIDGLKCVCEKVAERIKKLEEAR